MKNCLLKKIFCIKNNFTKKTIFLNQTLNNKKFETFLKGKS